MKRICFLIHSLYGGGAEKVVMTLTSTLLNMGHSVDIILLYDIIDYDLPQRSNFSLIKLQTKIQCNSHKNRLVKLLYHFMSILSARNKIKQHVHSESYDLIISHSPLTSILCMFLHIQNFYHCIHSEVLNKPLFQRKGKKNWNTLSRILYRKQRLITVSVGIKKIIKSIGIRFEFIQVIYNPFDIDQICRKAVQYSVFEKDYIIGVGRLHSAKRFDILIRAYARANLKQKLLIIGKGREEARLKKLISELNLEDRVELKGFHSNPYPFIKNAKALVVSSYYEGFSLTLVESLIVNTPVISTICSGTVEILTDELSQFLVPIGDIDALAKKIKQVIQSPPQIYSKYYEQFDHLKIAREYLSLIE